MLNLRHIDAPVVVGNVHSETRDVWIKPDLATSVSSFAPAGGNLTEVHLASGRVIAFDAPAGEIIAQLGGGEPG